MPNGTRDMLRMFTYFCSYFTHVYLFVLIFFILGKQYKKKEYTRKKVNRKKNLNIFEER